MKASVDLTNGYFSSYYIEWRLAKVLTNKILLEKRHEFYLSIQSQIKQYDDPDGAATVSQEIRNGLFFDTIAQTVQYSEDLFALIKASSRPEFFIRNIVTYSAGEVTSFLKGFKCNHKNTSQAFFLPQELTFNDAKINQTYEEDVQRLIEYVQDIQLFYKNYEFVYNQYKHGLAVALRPYGNLYGPQQIEQDMKGELDPYLAVWDNLNFKAASKRGNISADRAIMMPYLTPNVMPYAHQLQSENNFLRFVFPADIPMDIDFLVEMAMKIRSCITVFISNYQSNINPTNDGKKKWVLPENFKENIYHHYTLNQTA